VLVHTSRELYEIDLETQELTFIASLSNQITDLALGTDNVIYGLLGGSVMTIDRLTLERTELVQGVALGANGLGVGMDGELYMSAGPVVYRREQASFVAYAALGGYSSGDLVALADGDVLATVTGSSGDRLVRTRPGTEPLTVGELGHRFVYGLAQSRGKLFGFTEAGAVLQIDAETAATEVLFETSLPFWGAAGQ
jgi:hypothetical protein